MKTIKFNDKKYYSPLEIIIIVVLGIIISFPSLVLLSIFLVFMFAVSPLITIFSIIFIIFKMLRIKNQ
jgi:hypothetical protein